MTGNPDEVTLRQARYVLRDLHAKYPNCGYGKMADACERGADKLMAERHEAEAATDPFYCRGACQVPEN